jgi:hypothetical protein
MPQITIDFETFKEITSRRSDESVSEGDIVKEALRLSQPKIAASTPATGEDAAGEQYWESEGVQFLLGTTLEHRFRDGRIVYAQIVSNGVEMNGVVYSGLSPAGVAVTNHQLNGWLFWFLRDSQGRLVAADTLRKR